MANVKTITATTTESTINFEATYQYMWFRNLGETDCYISEHSGIVANADNVTLLKAGEVARLTLPQAPAQSKAYIKAADGSNTVEVHAQNYSDCPFKISGKGGESITIDPTPTQGSSNAVSSGGVYMALHGVSPVDYSTTEQNTGRKWIDGKPIYQKTFSLDITYGSSDVQKTTSISNTSIPNIDTLVDMTWIGDDLGGSRPANPAKLDSPMVKWYNKNDACFQVFIISQYDCVLKAITAWYTKTTDTAE